MSAKDEPWEADGGTLYNGGPHQHTFEIAQFAALDGRGRPDPIAAERDAERCKLAAGAPAMARVLLKLHTGKKRKPLMAEIARALREAGIIA